MPLLVSALLFLGGWKAALDSRGPAVAQVEVREGAAGGRDTGRKVSVRSVVDVHGPKLEIVWQQDEEVPVFELRAGARVYTREKRTGAPLLAGWQESGKAVLWLAASAGKRGSERFPFLPHAAADLGVQPVLESRALWAFFDASYRRRADPQYLARRWRAGGIGALHIAAWQFWEPHDSQDYWLHQLIDACHREAIQVYAWLEFPHVSERFWNDHPGWREKTATGQDAHLDWRKLMDLTNPDCAKAVGAGLRHLVERFDWDGINLAELYFESLEGAANPARFTPFAPSAQAALRRRTGLDPLLALRDPGHLPALLSARADLAAELQSYWLDRLAELRRDRSHLHLVLTHIDDRFDTTMRDKLGADAARLLPKAEAAGATFLIEDPATVWHLGSERYAEIARRYAPLAKRPRSLAIDLNIVERYQDVYPTKQQVGVEFLQLVRQAAQSFHRVALYFENSIARPDWRLLAAAASTAKLISAAPHQVVVEAPHGGVLQWPYPATPAGFLLNGKPWPAYRGGAVILPPGRSVVQPAEQRAALRIGDFNGHLRRVSVGKDGRLRVEYESEARAIVILENTAGSPEVLYLPPGANSTTLPPREQTN